MKIVNLRDIPEIERKSPKGKYQSLCKNVSVALGAANPAVGAQGDAHPFDLQIRRLPPGKSVCPYHAHVNQWELFVIRSGTAAVRRDGEVFQVHAGDVFIHPPGTAHQITNTSATDELVIQIIADNPPLDICRYPDSNKWAHSHTRTFFRMTEVDYFDGEE
jgi:uncharacterized cupin superfamily protein